MRFRTPLVHGDVTRLLIDLGKAGEERWSRFSIKLPEATREKVADRHERPYRMALNQRIAEDLRRHQALLHVMIHTDPNTDGLVMLETPPDSPLAERFAAAWRSKLAAADVDVRHVSGIVMSPLASALTASNTQANYGHYEQSLSQKFFRG